MLFEDHLEVWDIGKTADAGDLGDGKLRRGQSLLDLFQPCPEDDFSDCLALIFPKPKRGKRPRYAKMPHYVGCDVSIVKTGNGRLTISGNAANNACDLDIMSGTVAFGVKNSSAYRNVTVRSGATLDISKCNFVCTNLVKEPGGIIKHKPGLSIFIR